MSHKRVRSGQAAPAPHNPQSSSDCQDRRYTGNHWYFCQSCRAKVRRDHKNVRGFFCPGPVYEMDGYVQIPRKEAQARTWRLWMERFCQPFRILSR